MTDQLADVLYDYCESKPRQTRQCLQLSMNIYAETGNHVGVMVCMVRLGQVEDIQEYAEINACTTHQLAQVCRR